MLEKEIEKILVQEVKKLGGRAYKWVSPGNNGVPDRIIIFPGQMPIFAELKTDSGKSVIRPESPVKEAVRFRAAGACDIRHLRNLPVFSGSWI